VPEITSEELKARLDAGADLLLLDVREPHEAQICAIRPSTLIPLGEVPKRYAELDPNREMVVYCRSGVRSGKAVAFLRQQGFSRALNLKGGILDWIDKVDPSMPKY